MSTEKTINTRIKLKRDEESNWDSQNPTILNGEVVLVDGTDGRLRAKIGDGASTYSALGFIDHIHVITEDNKEDSIPQNAILVVDTTEENMTGGGNADFGTLKYKDANGQWRTVGAGLHTHLPSDIGAAEKKHGHDAATQSADGFLSSTDKTKIDNLNDVVFGNADKNIASLVDLVGESPVQEQISSAVADKVIKVDGKGLSTNDYTTPEKTKLANIDPYANNYSLPTAGQNTLGGVQTTSTVTSNSGYTACPIISGVPYYKDTNTKNTAGAGNTSSKIYLVGATSQSTSPTTYSHDTAYVGTDGCLYSNSTKVSTEGHTHTVDATLSSTSTNPVQNKVVYAIDNKVGEKPVSEQISNAITSATTTIGATARQYTDDKIAALINGAPSTLDTLGEIATAMAANANVVDALDKAIGTKVPTTRTVNGKALSSDISLTYSDVGAAQSGHDHDGRYYTETEVNNKISDHADDMASTSAPGHMSKEDKLKLDGLQNYTHPANHPASMITGLANVATTGSYNDLTNKPTIPAAYTHPTGSGNEHIPSGGSENDILRWCGDGAAYWSTETTYSNATTSKAGLMSATDKTNLNNVVAQLGGYTLNVVRNPNYVPPAGTSSSTITIVLPS